MGQLLGFLPFCRFRIHDFCLMCFRFHETHSCGPQSPGPENCKSFQLLLVGCYSGMNQQGIKAMQTRTLGFGVQGVEKKTESVISSGLICGYYQDPCPAIPCQESTRRRKSRLNLFQPTLNPKLSSIVQVRSHRPQLGGGGGGLAGDLLFPKS